VQAGARGAARPRGRGSYRSVMDPEARIRQFETMVRPEADPNNDMAWFSLGGAYRDAGRDRDAAEAFVRCFTLNPAMSKAYQLAGVCYIDAGMPERAAEVLTEGYRAAAARGDRMPMRAMGDLLQRLGRPVPEASGAAGAPGALAGGFVCRRTGRPGTRLPRPPFRGAVGQWIYENISAETWDSWIGQGTKVINELRLDLSRDQDSEVYDQHMREFLGIDDELYAQLTAPRPGTP
jgi:Fe-S cluster biosynthesis and repair protein YggX